jgi:hypothetical protein
MHKNLKLLLTIIFMPMLLFSCSSKSPKIYENSSPKFDIRKFFRGNLEAYGILQDRSGKVIKTFTVKMTGSWQGNEGVLKEDFVFSDNKTDHREWKISMIDDHNFTAKAGDVVGIAKGEQYGNALRMNYVLTIPVDGKNYDCPINDWMFLINDDSLINVSTITKFGFKVATLTIGFKKIGI